jgi:hypothetical protein
MLDTPLLPRRDDNYINAPADIARKLRQVNSLYSAITSRNPHTAYIIIAVPAICTVYHIICTEARKHIATDEHHILLYTVTLLHIIV